MRPHSAPRVPRHCAQGEANVRRTTAWARRRSHPVIDSIMGSRLTRAMFGATTERARARATIGSWFTGAPPAKTQRRLQCTRSVRKLLLVEHEELPALHASHRLRLHCARGMLGRSAQPRDASRRRRHDRRPHRTCAERRASARAQGGSRVGPQRLPNALASTVCEHHRRRRRPSARMHADCRGRVHRHRMRRRCGRSRGHQAPFGGPHRLRDHSAARDAQGLHRAVARDRRVRRRHGDGIGGAGRRREPSRACGGGRRSGVRGPRGLSAGAADGR